MRGTDSSTRPTVLMQAPGARRPPAGPVAARGSGRRRTGRRVLGVFGLTLLMAVLIFAGLTLWSAPRPNGGGAGGPAPVSADPTAESAPTEPPVQEDTPPPSGTTPPRPVTTTQAVEPSVPVVSSTAEAVAAAEQIGIQRGERVAVVVRDRTTGATYVAGDVDAPYASASVVKVFIATRLLVDGLAEDAEVKDQMWRMVTASDDAAATKLYPMAGGEGLAAWISDRYHVSGLVASNRPGYWGLTRITARAMVEFYTAVADDPVVGPWLLDAMGEGTRVGADGFNQYFGLMFTSHHWRLKQGWMCCLEDKMRMHSTGYVDHDRYVVAVLSEGTRDKYYDYGRRTLTLMAQALMPGGTIAGSA
jgi:hypothetical protein